MLAEKFNFPLNEKSPKLILYNKLNLLKIHAVVIATEGLPESKLVEKRGIIIECLLQNKRILEDEIPEEYRKAFFNDP